MTDLNPPPERNRDMENRTIETTDLHALLDSLTDGDHAKAVWSRTGRTTTIEGPVTVSGRGVWCDRVVRQDDGEINSNLTSFEVVRDEEFTVTRDDEEGLHALLDSLEDGQEVTAVWRSEDGSITATGTAMSDGRLAWVRGPASLSLRSHTGALRPALHSVTVRRPVVKRWERDGDECREAAEKREAGR